MKSITPRTTRIFAAGSLAAVAVTIALAPLNMGGCSSGNVDIGAVGSGLTKVVQSQQLGDRDEDSIGQSVAVQATNRWKIYADPNVARYVTLVGRTVGASSAQPKLKLYFAVLDTPEVNAFSGPHGYIFITRGALARMHDESELAGVLGHEIGHVCKKHGLAAVKQAGFTQGLMTAAAGSEKHIAAHKQLADGAADAIINKGFSQPQEEEADAEGVKYIIAAGYDPNGFLHFLERIKKEQGSGGKPFGTHPGIGDRIKKVNDQIAKAGAGGQGATLADRFQQNAALSH